MSSIVLNELKSFNIYIDHDVSNGIVIADLLNEEKCLQFLKRHMVEIKAPNIIVAASIFSKRYAYIVVSSTLYSMVRFNCVLDISINACSLGKDHKLCIQKGGCKWQEVCSMNRKQWRENVLYNLFTSQVTPVLEALTKATRIPSSILWENVAVRINSIYRNVLSEELNIEIVKHLYDDFNFLKNASGNLFNLKENPLKQYLKIGDELELDPYRKTCCMYHSLEEDVEGIGFCLNCLLRKKQTKEKF